MPDFTCATCQAAFSLPQSVLDRYPGWEPNRCRPCRDAKAPAKAGAAPAKRRAPRSVTASETLTTDEVLARFQEGPSTGLFTDGAAIPNPGPGGWGVVWVRDGVIVAERCGSDPATTNNRMEMTAVLEAYRLLPEDSDETIHSDSELVVRTVTQWAKAWERAGWKRKTGPIANLDLVQLLMEESRRRPRVNLQWIASHSGLRWNEYADALAGRWLEESRA